MPDKDNNIQKILEKLRKLMDLKVSATECGELGEANAAAAGITRLLREYDLTLQDIPAEQKVLDPVDIEDVPFRFTYSQHRWYWALQDVIASHNSCEIIRSQSRQNGKALDTSYKVVGRKQHREVVLYLISFCAHQFITIGKRKYPDYKINHIKQTGTTPKPLSEYMKQFLLGCVDGLYYKLEEEQNNIPKEKLNALVVANKNALDAFMADMDVKNARLRPIKADERIVKEGYQTGRNINLQKGIADNGQNRKKLIE